MKTGQTKYIATAGADKVITAQRAFLHRIIIGKDVSNAIVEISDHASDGDGDVQIYLSGSTLSGVYEIGTEFNKGICADLTLQTNVTFVFENRGAN